MASRDKFEHTIICPKCGQRGQVHESENDYAFMSKSDRTIDSVDGEFDVSRDGDFSPLSVVCRKCGTQF